MKTKHFFYFAMSIMMAMCVTACGDDNDDENGGGSSEKSAIVTPRYADAACTLTMSGNVDLGNDFTLAAIDLTESGRAYFTIKYNGTKSSATTNVYAPTSVINANYTYNNNVYTIKGQHCNGKVEIISTRKSETVSVDVDIDMQLEDGTTLSYSTDTDGALTAMQTVNQKSGDTDIISTWKVRGMIIDLEGDVNVFKMFNSGDLRQVRDEAIAQGAEFTTSEMKDFEKTVTMVTISNNLLTIDYSDGKSDAGTWDWANSNYSNFTLHLIHHDMGNKFIVDNAKASVEFKKEKALCNVTLDANITGSKNYTAKFTLQMEQVSEAK